MSVSELCTLAPWDELAAFRREVHLKFDEAFVMVQERREGEARVAHSCQQLEAKLERFARQTRGLHSRSEVFEGHLTGQAKDLDACKEVQEALRERLQRATLEWTSTHHGSLKEWTSTHHGSLSSMRTELDATIEQRYELALEACRRGDHAIADELLKKMGELNSKLGANMQSLEEELLTDFKKLRGEVQLQVQLQGQQRTELVDAQVSIAAGVEARLGQLEGEMEKLEVHGAAVGAVDRTQGEHGSRLGDAENKLAKLQEYVSRLESRMSAMDHATTSKLEELKEQVEEGAGQTSSGLVRLRSEAETTMREAVRGSRDDLREDIRALREDISKNVQDAREDFRSNLASCRDFAQTVQHEALAGVTEVKGNLGTMCRDVCSMVQEVRQQVSDVQTEMKTEMKSEVVAINREIESRVTDVRLREITDQLASLQDEASQTNAHERLVTLSDKLTGTMQGLTEASAALTRYRTSSEAAIAELRHDGERRESTTKRYLTETLDEVQQQLDTVRIDGQERATMLQREVEEFSQRVAHAERAAEAQASELREQLRERLRESAHSLAKMSAESQALLEERLQSLSRQSDVGLSAVRGELSTAAALAREARAESERTCQRFIEEVAENQEVRLAEVERMSGASLNEAFNELRQDLSAIRGTMTNQALDAVGRAEQLVSERVSETVNETHKQTEGVKHMIEALEIKIDEQLTAFASNTRHTLQESRQELRTQITTQLEERMRPLSDRLAEATGDFHALKRSEKQSSDRLSNTCSELAVAKESLARVTQQCSFQNQELLEIRAWAGVRCVGEKQACRPASSGRLGRGASRERPTEFRSFRDELGARSELPASARLSNKVDSETPARLAPRTEGGDWSFSGPRHKPRASFEAIIAASPLLGDGVRKSRTPSPTLGGLRDDNWTFGNRQRMDSLVSPRGTLLSSKMPLGNSPPRSPHALGIEKGLKFAHL